MGILFSINKYYTCTRSELASLAHSLYVFIYDTDKTAEYSYLIMLHWPTCTCICVYQRLQLSPWC